MASVCCIASTNDVILIHVTRSTLQGAAITEASIRSDARTCPVSSLSETTMQVRETRDE